MKQCPANYRLPDKTTELVKLTNRQVFCGLKEGHSGPHEWPISESWIEDLAQAGTQFDGHVTNGSLNALADVVRTIVGSELETKQKLRSLLPVPEFKGEPQAPSFSLSSSGEPIWYCLTCHLAHTGETCPTCDSTKNVSAPQARQTEPCKIPPFGWYCTRAKGHEGPCAAVPIARDWTGAPLTGKQCPAHTALEDTPDMIDRHAFCQLAEGHTGDHKFPRVSMEGNWPGGIIEQAVSSKTGQRWTKFTSYSATADFPDYGFPARGWIDVPKTPYPNGWPDFGGYRSEPSLKLRVPLTEESKNLSDNLAEVQRWIRFKWLHLFGKQS